MAEKRIPAIRSAEFTDDWEQRKLGDIADFSKGTGYSKADIQETGTPLILYGRLYTKYELVISDVDTFAAVRPSSVFSKGGEVIVPASGETAEDISVAAVVEKPGILLGGDLNIVSPSSNLDAPFLALTISHGRAHGDLSKRAQGKSIVHLHNDDLQTIDLFLPSIDEQKAIGGFFRHLDHLITLHQRKYEKLMNVRASMLENLFVQSGDSTPKIRFGEYTKPWKKVPLSELVQLYSDPVETPHGGYDRLGIRSHGKGVFHDHVEVGKELGTAKMHRVAAHNLIVNITFAWEHAVAITTEDDEGKLVSHRFPQFSMTEDVYDQFLKYLVLDPGFRHHLLLASPGGAGRNRVLKVPEMLQYEMMIPEIEEQKEIAGYLNSLDELIALYAQRMEQLKHIKQAFLQKMFP